MIDSEESWIQSAIDEIIISLMKKYNNEKVVVATTIQLYLKNRDNYYREHLKNQRIEFYLCCKNCSGCIHAKRNQKI